MTLALYGNYYMKEFQSLEIINECLDLKLSFANPNLVDVSVW